MTTYTLIVLLHLLDHFHHSVPYPCSSICSVTHEVIWTDKLLQIVFIIHRSPVPVLHTDYNTELGFVVPSYTNMYTFIIFN